MKKDIIKELKESLKHNRLIDNDLLWAKADDNIFAADCILCLEKIGFCSEYSICQVCQTVAHAKCDNRWRAKNNNCMHCRS